MSRTVDFAGRPQGQGFVDHFFLEGLYFAPDLPYTTVIMICD